MNSTPKSSVADVANEAQRVRTSEILRGILTQNPEVELFSVECILASIGSERVETALMMFSLPGIVPVTSPSGFVALPTGALSAQLVSGWKQIRIPRFILNKSVSRRSLAVAIHAILPILEAAERVVRPRWSWVTHPIARRAVGLLIFLLAVAIAYPLFSTNAIHAMSIFVVSLGMVERDGLAVLIGVVAGVLSLVVLASSGLSLRALRAKARNALRRFGKRIGLTAIARYLEKHGYTRLARLLTFEWSALFMSWDPERRSARRVSRAARPGRTPRQGPQRQLPASEPPATLSLALPADLRGAGVARAALRAPVWN